MTNSQMFSDAGLCPIDSIESWIKKTIIYLNVKHVLLNVLNR